MQEETIVPEGWSSRAWQRHKEIWSNREIFFSILLSLVAIALSAAANAFSDLYATEKASSSVTDIILSNVPVVTGVEDIFVYGALAVVLLIAILCILHPKRAPFTLYTLSLVFFVRAIFVSLTHIGPYPDHVIIDVHSKILLAFFGGGDQFFSGHTTLPFMMALIYWHDRLLRYIFLAASVILGVVVLLGHLHYTIDVLSAFFISYSVYAMALWLFPKERALFFNNKIPSGS
ncbi:MAG: hypothetical protein KGJ34_00285 [Patescibacteria group bacterium]|nr:hypothetical protein [Patescibacteria group bacterium]